MAGFIEYLTDEGARMLAKMASGKKITFSKVMVGDGELPTGQEPKNVTELISPKITLDVESVTMASQTNVVITANLSNEKVTESFYYKEKGIYMSDGTTEVLGIYGNSGGDGELIEPLTSFFIKKKLKTVLDMSNADNINIEIKASDYSPAPVIPDSKIEDIKDFLSTREATTIEQGSTVILNNIVYTFLGGDPTDLNNYADSKKNEVIKEEKELLANIEYEKVADAMLTKSLFRNVLKLNKINEFAQTETIFVDENTIKTVYVDGRMVVTQLQDDTITTKFYNEENEVLKIRTVKITDDKIQESEEIIKEDEDFMQGSVSGTGEDDYAISIDGDTIVIDGNGVDIDGETLVLN